MIDIAYVLSEMYPRARWQINGEQVYANLVWLDEKIPKPTEAQIAAKAAEIEAQYPLDQCKTEAKKRIAATDWSVLPDVGLANVAAFEAYRAALRELIKNPVADPVWPIEPEPIWS